MDTVAIDLPKNLYELVTEQAAHRNQTPEQFVLELLSEHLMPAHPYVEIVQGRGGPRPVIKDTRIGIDVIVGYSQAGYNPKELCAEILPDLSLAQIYDALSYYEDHRSLMDQAMEANSPEAWEKRIQSLLGEVSANKLFGR